MATATYLKGQQTTIEYLAGADIAVGTILLTSTNDSASVGVALNAIANGAVGMVDITGCYIFPKVSGAVIKAGESVDWDSSEAKVEDNASTLATGDVGDFAVALEDAGNGTTTIKIMLDPNKVVT